MFGFGPGRRCAVAAVVACATSLCAACTTGSPATAVHGASSQATAMGGLATVATRRALAARYLVIAKAGNRRLDADFGLLEGRDKNHLAAAQAELRDVAATEQLFDRSLLKIAFPPKIELIARLLYRVNQARAMLTSAAAASTSLRQLHAFELQLDAANGPVEQAVRTLRSQLGLPPPSTS